jgi:hypothetical protein
MSQLFRFPSSVKRDPAIEVWMHGHSGELGAIAQRWFEAMRACGGDVRELLHDGHPTACVGDAAFASDGKTTNGADLLSPERIGKVTMGGVGRLRFISLRLTPTRRGVVLCRYAPILIRITDTVLETYEWTAVAGFVPIMLRYPLLGYAGVLQFFDAHFQGADQEVILNPNWAFTGRRI